MVQSIIYKLCFIGLVTLFIGIDVVLLIRLLKNWEYESKCLLVLNSLPIANHHFLLLI